MRDKIPAEVMARVAGMVQAEADRLKKSGDREGLTAKHRPERESRFRKARLEARDAKSALTRRPKNY